MKLNMPFRMVSVAGLLASVRATLAHWLPRPQDPRSRPYQVMQVRFQGGADEVRLEGELTMPVGDGPFTAIILLTGSGPQDRNESIAGHKPFLVLSDHLTRQGFAVLRTDDRGVGKSSGDYGQAALSDFAADAAAAYAWLSARSEIDGRRIGFLGHSEGGYTAPAAARRVPARFMILLAGPAKPLLPDVMDTQIADINRSRNSSAEASDKERQTLASLVDILKSAKTPADAEKGVRTLFESAGASKAEVSANVGFWGTRWAMEYVNHDPLPALKNFSGPVLALYGDRDLQVSAVENEPVMRPVLQNPHSEVRVMPGLNHLFQPSETGRVEDYVHMDVTIDPSVLLAITDWLNEQDWHAE